MKTFKDIIKSMKERMKKCKKCGYVWICRDADDVRLCPSCHTARWNIGPVMPKRKA